MLIKPANQSCSGASYRITQDRKEHAVGTLIHMQSGLDIKDVLAYYYIYTLRQLHGPEAGSDLHGNLNSLYTTASWGIPTMCYIHNLKIV